MGKELIALLAFTITLTSVNGQITEEEYRLLLNQKFRTLLTGYNSAIPGGFTGLELSDAKFAFSPGFQFKNGHVLNGNINGGITEGYADIFKNKKLNTNVSLGCDYHFLNHKRTTLPWTKIPTRTLHTDYGQQASLRKKIATINDEFLTDSLLILAGEKLRERESELLQKQLDNARLYATRSANATNGLTSNEINAWNLLVAKDLQELTAIQDTLTDPTKRAIWNLQRMREAQAKRNAAKKEVGIEKLDITECELGWWTIGATVRNDAFKRFDDTLDYNDRLISEKFLSKQFRVSYSYLRLSKEMHRTRLFTLGFKWNIKSNFQDLETIDVLIETAYGDDVADTTSSMTSVKKYTAYVGEYHKNVNEGILSADYYHFFTNTFAWHGYGTWRMQDKIRPELNLGIGLIHSFLAKKDQKSIINAEVYITLLNIWNSIKSDHLDVLDQSKLGLRFSFPINFN